MSQKTQRALFNCLVKTKHIPTSKELQLAPHRFRIDRMIIKTHTSPGFIYFEGPDPLRQRDFLQIIEGIIGRNGFKILRHPNMSSRPATLPRVQQARYPHLAHQPGVALPPLPDPNDQKWWTTKIRVTSMADFGAHMREMGIYGWFRQALIDDEEKPTKNVY
jgi:hypothetical protein